jgi:hypothetical protein
MASDAINKQQQCDGNENGVGSIENISMTKRKAAKICAAVKRKIESGVLGRKRSSASPEMAAGGGRL